MEIKSLNLPTLLLVGFLLPTIWPDQRFRLTVEKYLT